VGASRATTHGFACMSCAPADNVTIRNASRSPSAKLWSGWQLAPVWLCPAKQDGLLILHVALSNVVYYREYRVSGARRGRCTRKVLRRRLTDEGYGRYIAAGISGRLVSLHVPKTLPSILGFTSTVPYGPVIAHRAGKDLRIRYRWPVGSSSGGDRGKSVRDRSLCRDVHIVWRSRSGSLCCAIHHDL